MQIASKEVTRLWLIPNFGTVLPESLGYLPVVSTILGYEHHVILGKKDSKNIPSVSPEAHLALVHGMLRFVEGYGVFLAQFARKPGLVDTLISPLPGFFPEIHRKLWPQAQRRSQYCNFRGPPP